MKQPFETPRVERLGSMVELTQANNRLCTTDVPNGTPVTPGLPIIGCPS